MGKPTMVTRAMLIGFCVYGIIKFCMLFRPWAPDKYLVIAFIVLLVVSIWSLLDWTQKK